MYALIIKVQRIESDQKLPDACVSNMCNERYNTLLRAVRGTKTQSKNVVRKLAKVWVIFKQVYTRLHKIKHKKTKQESQPEYPRGNSQGLGNRVSEE